MSLASSLFRAARAAATITSITRGPSAIADRQVRKVVIRTAAKAGIFRTPK